MGSRQVSPRVWAELKARFHFNSIAHDNTSLSSTIITSPPASRIESKPLTSPSTPTPITLLGTQTIHKFTHNPTGAPRPGHEGDEPDQVWIAVALWRCWMGKKKADLVLSVNVNLGSGQGAGNQAEQQRVSSWLERAVQSLRIEDWGLFGDSDE